MPAAGECFSAPPDTDADERPSLELCRLTKSDKKMCWRRSVAVAFTARLGRAHPPNPRCGLLLCYYSGVGSAPEQASGRRGLRQNVAVKGLYRRRTEPFLVAAPALVFKCGKDGRIGFLRVAPTSRLFKVKWSRGPVQKLGLSTRLWRHLLPLGRICHESPMGPRRGQRPRQPARC